MADLGTRGLVLVASSLPCLPDPFLLLLEVPAGFFVSGGAAVEGLDDSCAYKLTRQEYVNEVVYNEENKIKHLDAWYLNGYVADKLIPVTGFWTQYTSNLVYCFL